MTKKRITMNKIREILRMNEEADISHRKIARALKISRPVVSQYLTDFKTVKLKYADIKNISDTELLDLIEKKKVEATERYKELSDYFEYFTQELKKKTGVTLYILWQEYKEKHPEGYSYSRFCYHYQVWRNHSQITMHIEHKAGDKMFVDFAGDKICYIDSQTGEEKKAEVFVAILGASQRTYAEATESQQKGEWIKANENAFLYFEGVTAAIVPDNLKSAVTKANKYEPDINPEFWDFARYYNTVILPARPYCEKDKALVENAVRLIYMRVYAPLRNRTFSSLKELNEAIRELVDKHNNINFQRLKINRRQLFENIERKQLKPLPSKKYIFKSFAQPTVQFNYHVELREDRHYYSVPNHNRGKKALLLYTDSVVEIYIDNIRIITYKRDRTPNGYTTREEHMPPEHQYYAKWTPQRFINWGESLGKHVKKIVTEILKRRPHPEQAYKVCMGILNLSNKFDPFRLNAACQRAIYYNSYSYKTVKNILDQGLDSILDDCPEQLPLPNHENIRGSEYYEEEVLKHEGI